MKKALIAGFFDKVEDAVRQRFGAFVDRGDIVIVGLERGDPRPGLNVALFKAVLARVMTGGCTDVLVVLGRSRSASWVQNAVEAILASHSERCRIERQVLDDLQDAQTILKHLNDFGLIAQPSDADAVLLTQALQGQRLFCVRASKQASFERTLERLGFVFDPEQFVEEVVAASHNSNLIQVLSNKAEQFDWLLYAWAGLRTLPSEVKRKFRIGSLEADSPMKVCTMLKRRLLKQSGS